MKRLLTFLFALLLVVQIGASAFASETVISVIIDPVTGGTATHSLNEESVVVTPLPLVGYKFDSWSYTVNNDPKPVTNINPLIIPLTGSSMHIVVTPHFIKEEYTINVSAGVGGTVSGGGVYEAGEHYTVTATPDTGYVFDKWTEDGDDVPNSPGASFYGIAERNHNYHAYFIGQTHTVTATVEPASSGTVNSGSYYSETFNYAVNPSASITAAPATGFVFDGWYENGSKISSSASELFSTNRDRILFAKFTSDSTSTTTPSTETGTSTTVNPVPTGRIRITYMPDSNSTPTTPFQSEWYAGNVFIAGQYYGRQGYTQTGWTTYPGQAKVYGLNQTTYLDHDITLYPFWESISKDLYLTVDIGQGGGVRLSGGNVPNGWTGKLSPNTSFTFYLYPNQGNYVYRIGLAGWHYPIQSGSSFTVTYEMMQGRNQTLVIRFADARSHPPTGDDSQIALWSALGIMSFSAIIILTAKRKKKQ